MPIIDIKNISYDDPETWKLIQSGLTKGIWQMESKLVQHWTKKIKPSNLWELSAVIALVRPGPLDSGFADDYVEYIEGTKKVESFGHPVIDSIFDITNHTMIYQEQLMSLGSKLAWPHEEESERLKLVDTLRKAVGKKDQRKILSIGEKFLEGCAHNDVDIEVAERLFDVIKKSGRYVFNLSHSYAYAELAYKTAYLKAHYPKVFYATYLSYNKYKQIRKWENLEEIIDEARLCGHEILSPNINAQNIHYKIENTGIRMGLGHIKYIGSSCYPHIKQIPEINDWRQVILLTCTKELGFKLNSRASEGLICCGAFIDTRLTRKTLLSIHEFFSSLTDREMSWVIDNWDEYSRPEEINTLIERMLAEKVCNARRAPVVRDNLSFMNLNQYDHPGWIELQEKKYLGIALTASKLDAKDMIAESTCQQCMEEHPPGFKTSLCVEIKKIVDRVTKRGKNPGQKMASIYVQDSSGKLDNLPVFPDAYDKYLELLIEGNTVFMYVKMGKTGWIVESMSQI